MNRIITTLLLSGTMAVSAGAQTLNVVVGQVTYAFPATQTGYMPYQNGNTLTVMGKSFSVDDITRMYVDYSDVTDNSVTVSYQGTEAAVVVAGNVARYVQPTLSGAHVSIVQSDEVSDTTCGEIVYTLSGTSADGAFVMEGSYKATVELNGLTLTNPSGAAILIQDGKRIDLSVKKETVNTLTDGAGGDQKGCLACKGHLELKGKGTLNIYGNTAHAIYAKEYVEMKNCTVNVLSAVKDGINCNQYFLLESGALTISGVADDGVQVSYKDDTDREEDDTGALTIAGGTLQVTVTGKAAKGLKAEGDITVADGTLSITTTGNGTWDSDDAKTKASACISADGAVAISGGELTLASSGAGGKGIGCDGDLTISGGTVGITTTGGMYAYVNGTEYTNYTGESDRLSNTQKSSPKGIRAEGNVLIAGGNITVSTSGNNAEGIESKKVLTIDDGTVLVNAYDDAINSSSHMYINGGNVTVVAKNNDGLDSNGNMYITGGVTMAFGTSSPECGIDANEEDNYTVFFTGGTLLAVGGGNSVPSTSASTQPYVTGNLSVTAGNEVTLKSGSDTLASFTVPSTYSSSQGGWGGRAAAGPGGGGPGGGGNPGGGGGNPGGGGQGGSASVLITCAGLTQGSSYTITSGSASATATAVLTGSNGRP